MYGEKDTIAGDFEKFLNEYEKAGVILPIPGGTRVARMNRVKKMLEERRIKRWKISTKLLLLILVMGAVSLGRSGFCGYTSRCRDISGKFGTGKMV